jgi:hypothetical protein
MFEEFKKFWDENQLLCGSVLGAMTVTLIMRSHYLPAWRVNTDLAKAFSEVNGNFSNGDGTYNLLYFGRK